MKTSRAAPFRDRLALSETLDGSYLLTDFTRLGATGSLAYYSYAGGGVTDTDDLSVGSTFYGEYTITGKSRLRLELGFGDDHQSTGSAGASDRSYEQALLKVNYVPSEKLSFDVGLGVGIQQDSGVVGQTSGAHPVYTIDARYTPTEKISASLHFGYEGADVEPDFSLLDQMAATPQHHRRPLGVPEQRFLHLPGISQNLTTRGILATIQQKFFEKVEIDLGGGRRANERLHEPRTGAAITVLHCITSGAFPCSTSSTRRWRYSPTIAPTPAKRESSRMSARACSRALRSVCA